jgi:NitT/TauT family transport system ATP-binding protein
METVNAEAPIIRIRGLALSFEQEGRRTDVLRHLDLDVQRGEFVAIVGASGVGKSTLLRVLIGLVQPTAGEVEVNPDPEAERPMALVFQDARLLPWRSVLANVAFGLEKTDLSRVDRLARAHRALAVVGLEAMAKRWPHQLSGGQRQRVAIARALAVNPSILLMDEPFSALDIGTREGLQDEVTRIWSTTGKTILFVTHDIDEAVYLADRVIALGGSPGEVRSVQEIAVLRPRKRNLIALAEIAMQLKADISAEAGFVREDWVI